MTVTDVHDKAARSRNMSAIRSRNTKPEVQIRRLLHAAGFRFRIHRKDLPGTPDIVLPKYRVVILVHGCFWHGHNCYLFKVPATRPDFWLQKIAGNRSRDEQQLVELKAMGWRVMTVWECALKGPRRLDTAKLAADLRRWIVDCATEGDLAAPP